MGPEMHYELMVSRAAELREEAAGYRRAREARADRRARDAGHRRRATFGKFRTT